MITERSLRVLSAKRLTLRPLCTEDAEFLARLDSDPRVMEHIGEGALSAASALKKASIEIEMASLRFQFGKWLVELHDGGARIGWVEVAKYRGPRIDASLSDDLQIGYQFAPEYWGMGYATEAVQAVASHAFHSLQLERLIAYARVENRRSHRVLNKAGFEPVCTWQEGENHTSTLYVLHANRG